MKNKRYLMLQWIKGHSLILKLIFFGSVLVFMANQTANIVNDMSQQDIWQRLGQRSYMTILLMILTELLGITPMLLYDWATIRVLEKQGRPKMERKEFLLAVWVINAINNPADFGGVVGASFRASFYGEQTNRKMVLVTVSKVTLFMLTGLSVWSFLIFIDVSFIQSGGILQSYWIRLLGSSFLAPVIFFSTYLKRKSLFSEFYPKGLFGLLLASLGQWVGVLAVFLTIGKLMRIDISMFSIYPMFMTATLIGMLTMIPGGMGIFDVSMILGMSRLSVRQDVAVVWLLHYRLFYYVLPFLTGLLLFIIRTGVRINRFSDNIPRLLFQKVAHIMFVSAVYFAGAMMVLLSTIIDLSAISRSFQVLLPFSFDFLDQTLNLLVGFSLPGLVRALSVKVKKAFLPTIALLAFGILNTITRILSWQLLLVYVLILLAVWLFRKESYQTKFVYSWGAILLDASLFDFLFIVYAIAGYHNGRFLVGRITGNHFILFPSGDVWFSGLIGLGISLLALVALYQYLAGDTTTLGSEYEKERFGRLLEAYGGIATSHQLRLSECNYFYYQKDDHDQAVFGYQIKGNKCFVLRDPIGNPKMMQAAANQFMKRADCLGHQLAFYEISESYVVMLYELGFHFTKVGEAEIVDLTTEDLSRLNQQLEYQRLMKGGYYFIWYDQLLEELHQAVNEVLQRWLYGIREKYFSVGRFDESYVLSSGVGIVRKEQKVVGFITAQPMTKEQAGYDLLRILLEEPEELADYLLANLFIVYERMGYLEASLGLAPLANVGETDFSFFQEKVMHIVYNYGNFFYSFQSAYEKKLKYVDHWEGRYFTYRKGSNFGFTTMQLFSLIGKERGNVPSLAEEVLTEL